jgi:hypothetical protein
MFRAGVCIDCKTDSGRLRRCLFLCVRVFWAVLGEIILYVKRWDWSVVSSLNDICGFSDASKAPSELMLIVLQLLLASWTRSVSTWWTAEYGRRPSWGVCVPLSGRRSTRGFAGWCTRRRKCRGVVFAVGHDWRWLDVMHAGQFYPQSELGRANGGVSGPTRRVAWHGRRVWLPGAARNEINGIHRQRDPNRGARGCTCAATKTTARKP